MKITIESTNRIVQVSGLPARVWEGRSESGIRVVCFVPQIGILKTADIAKFERELQESTPPSDLVDWLLLDDLAKINPHLVM